jgi:hypothetical protein
LLLATGLTQVGTAGSTSGTRATLFDRRAVANILHEEDRPFALPIHPPASANKLGLDVQIDGGPVMLLDFRTFGRSEEWKHNVLGNAAIRTIPLRHLPASEHRIGLHTLDPGFLLDWIDVRLDWAPDYYGAAPAE